jgi:poly(3-hydroxybutyrate) depolymerase
MLNLKPFIIIMLSFLLAACQTSNISSGDIKPPKQSLKTINDPLVSARTVEQVIRGETVSRHYLVRFPKTNTAQHYPVVFFFHGAGGEGLGLYKPEAIRLIDRGEFIGVFPSGYKRRWNVSVENNADDVGFFKKMLLDLAKDSRVDLDKVYGIGFSNGAGMVNRLAKETALLQGIAPIVSQQLTQLGNITPQRPVSVFQVNGQRDKVIPLRGGLVFGRMHFMSAWGSARNWASHFSCQQDPEKEFKVWGNYRVRITRFEHCLENKAVKQVVIHDAGHNIRQLRSLDLYDRIWTFFKNN